MKRARVYVSGLGFYELWINGQRVGMRRLAPGFTDYTKRVLYNTYDVTKLLAQGKNAIGAELGRGWYSMTTKSWWDWDKAPWRSEPKLLIQMEITYSDGTTDVIGSGPSWRVTDGPTLSDSIYLGETYDARLALLGWTTPGFVDTHWALAIPVLAPDGLLHSDQSVPIEIVQAIDPQEISEPMPGLFVFDFKQNVAGWAQLLVSGPAGTTVRLTYGEKLHPDGTVDIDQDPVEGRIQTDSYVLSGAGSESWEPRFSYKGYQYVQVEGFPGRPTLDALEGRIVRANVPSVGTFATSSTLLNQIHANTVGALSNNLSSVITDTPLWEKNGWTGDAQVTAGAANYNLDMAPFYTKWLADFLDSQGEDGDLPNFVPTGGYGRDGSFPDWEGAFIILPWTLYRFTGDRRLLESVYDGWRRYLAHLATQAKDHILDSSHGDWVAPGRTEGQPPEGARLTSTAYYYLFAKIASKVATILGAPEDRDGYADLAARIAEAFNREFFDANTGTYVARRDPSVSAYRQTSNVFPLAFGLVPPTYETAVMTNLINDIERRGMHLDTGILGTRYLLEVLTEQGFPDVAYQIASQTTYPSWGWWLAHGANSLYECWQLDCRSRSHHFFGSIDQWFYQNLVGLKPTNPGFETFRVAPPVFHECDSPTWARATHRSPYGEISAGWSISSGRIHIHVVAPPNTMAEVFVPSTEGSSVLERGTLASSAPGVKSSSERDGYLVFTTGSGVYDFSSLVAPRNACADS